MLRTAVYIQGTSGAWKVTLWLQNWIQTSLLQLPTPNNNARSERASQWLSEEAWIYCSALGEASLSLPWAQANPAQSYKTTGADTGAVPHLTTPVLRSDATPPSGAQLAGSKATDSPSNQGPQTYSRSLLVQVLLSEFTALRQGEILLRREYLFSCLPTSPLLWRW